MDWFKQTGTTFTVRRQNEGFHSGILWYGVTLKPFPSLYHYNFLWCICQCTSNSPRNWVTVVLQAVNASHFTYGTLPNAAYSYDLNTRTYCDYSNLINRAVLIWRHQLLLTKPTSPSTVKMESAFWGSKCFIRRLLRWFSTRSWTWAGSTPGAQTKQLTGEWHIYTARIIKSWLDISVLTHLNEPLCQQINSLCDSRVVLREKLDDVFWRAACLEIPATKTAGTLRNQHLAQPFLPVITVSFRAKQYCLKMKSHIFFIPKPIYDFKRCFFFLLVFS